jgi:hypothetical protein
VYGWAQYGGTSAAWAKVDPASGKVASRGTASYEMLAYGYGYGGSIY